MDGAVELLSQGLAILQFIGSPFALEDLTNVHLHDKAGPGSALLDQRMQRSVGSLLPALGLVLLCHGHLGQLPLWVIPNRYQHLLCLDRVFPGRTLFCVAPYSALMLIFQGMRWVPPCQSCSDSQWEPEVVLLDGSLWSFKGTLVKSTVVLLDHPCYCAVFPPCPSSCTQLLPYSSSEFPKLWFK